MGSRVKLPTAAAMLALFVPVSLGGVRSTRVAPAPGASDSDPPLIEIFAPSQPEGTTFDVDVRAWEPNGVARISLSVGADIVASKSAGHGTFRVTVDALPVEVCALAEDFSGNIARACRMVGGPFACRLGSSCDQLSSCVSGRGDCGGQGACLPRPDACQPGGDPVCGCDGKTYASECLAASNGVSILGEGVCRDDACQSNRVCGVWLYCRKLDGFCGSRGICAAREACRCPLLGITPHDICGCDGRTYDCYCELIQAGVNYDHDGPCRGGR